MKRRALLRMMKKDGWVFDTSGARDSAGLSMDQAADRIGVAKGTYQRWEHPGKCNARVDTLEKIAKAFGRHFVGSFVA